VFGERRQTVEHAETALAEDLRDERRVAFAAVANYGFEQLLLRPEVVEEASL
jgi:hypothetical protein